MHDLLDTIAQPLADAAPLMLSVTWAVLVVIGVLLWVLGRRLARPACVVSGLVLGAAAGLVLGDVLADQGAMTIPLVIGTAIAGALLAGLLFRIWMGLSGAVLLGLAVPAAVLVWQGTPPLGLGTTTQPAATQPAEEESLAPPGRVGLSATGDSEPPPSGEGYGSESPPTDPRQLLEDELDDAVASVTDTAKGWYDRQREHVGAWWDELSPEARQRMVVAGALGALLGLVLGLAVPYMAAALESALVGSLLILIPLQHLLAAHAPAAAAYLPQTPRAWLVWLGLITLVGVLLQWTLFRKRADK